MPAATSKGSGRPRFPAACSVPTRYRRVAQPMRRVAGRWAALRVTAVAVRFSEVLGIFLGSIEIQVKIERNAEVCKFLNLVWFEHEPRLPVRIVSR